MGLPTQTPIAFDATESSLIEAAKNHIATTKALWDQVVSSVDPKSANWENVIVPIIEDENKRVSATRYLGFYKSTSPDASLRAASNTASGLLDDAEVELYGRTDMFALIDAVRDHIAAGAAVQDPEPRYYLEKMHRKFIHSGCGINDAGEKAVFMQYQRRIREIERQCNKNHHDESTRVCFSRDELAGVPESFLKQLTTDEQGIWVSTKVAQSGKILSNARKGETRKKMFYSIQNKMPDNIALFRELILLRDKAARLLGYPNHAAMRIGDKMMRSPEAVTSMLQDLEARLVPEGARDVARLLEIKQAEATAAGNLGGSNQTERVFLWDVSYLAQLQDQREKAAAVQVADYFELHHTLDRLLGIFQHLFGVQFKKVTAEEQQELSGGKPLVWDDDVLMYSVWDTREQVTGSTFMGYAYLDLHPRQGKYTHSGHYSLQPVTNRLTKNYDKPDGSHNKASSVLVMNYMKTAGRPTLLGLGDVRKLFHEIGHLVHALCTRTKYAASQQVDRDFVEAPALMFEQFFWQAQLIQDVSHHYAWLSPEYEMIWRETLPDAERASSALPPQRMPEGVAVSIASSDVKRRALREELNSLFFAKYDLMIHSPESHEALEKMNLTAAYNKMKSEIRSLAGGEALGEGLEWGHGETVFRAVINKYDAGYYSYVLGSILASEIFASSFASDPMSPSTGSRYREEVLRWGGSKPELEIITDYLGRPPNTGAFLRHLGLEL
ncbi:hypothetical protein KVR01_008171 [Diaporthe batatas]|uniref:uncharacterized protein n=1 Tax=Diaporthe batatas TaxID=748121 RepID=UPI001D03EA9A|nr:uncharacterized protein KVR01_008171 [Diaporthe batatas]KAG8162406.1 hypothetical protein KVR01_008171 [Diaporthe batatas]